MGSNKRIRSFSIAGYSHAEHSASCPSPYQSYVQYCIDRVRSEVEWLSSDGLGEFERRLRKPMSWIQIPPVFLVSAPESPGERVSDTASLFH